MVPGRLRVNYRDRVPKAVSTRTRGRSQRVGGTEHATAGLDSIKTLPDHADDRARGHVLDEAREEGPALEISVV